jgi:hypothetical protein
MIPLLRELCESKLFPSTKTAHEMETEEVAELLFLHILGMRILATDEETREFAKDNAHKTTSWNNFDKWRANGTDLYVLLHIMQERALGLKKGHYPVSIPLIQRWLRQISVSGIDEPATHRLFNRLDFDLRIRDDSLKSIRRLVIYWPDLSHHRRELAMTRLLQKYRAQARKSEFLGLLTKIAKRRDLEIDGVCNPETGHGCTS